MGMPGKKIMEDVAKIVADHEMFVNNAGLTSDQVRGKLGYLTTDRTIRYALATLTKAGRLVRKKGIGNAFRYKTAPKGHSEAERQADPKTGTLHT